MIATIIILLLLFARLVIDITLDGQNKVVKHDGLKTLVSIIIALILYYYAGLFDKFYNL